MDDDFDEIDWHEEDFSKLDAATTGPARVLRAVKELLEREGHQHIAVEYPAGDALMPPSSSDTQVAALLGAKTLAVLPPKVFTNGKINEAALFERLEQTRKSLFERFRGRTHRLSVSDLVGPMWCETQFYYGLLGRRNWRPENRPTVIVLPPKPGDTGPPKQIIPNQELLKARDGVLQRGNRVHANLERELAPEPAKPIFVDTRVDRVGAQLLDLCAALNALVVDGIAREVPILGVAEGFAIAGVIDEIYRKELDQPGPKSKGKLPANDKQQSSLDAFFTVKAPVKRYGYFILDHKTRNKRTLPSESAAQAGHMQLMIYKRLFDDLVLGSFDWSEYFARQGIGDTSAPFTRSFLDQTKELRDSVGPGAGVGIEEGLSPENLDDLLAVLSSYLQRIGPLQDELRLKYLLRERAAPKANSEAIRAKALEETDIALAIETSLQGTAHSAEEEELAMALAISIEDMPAKPLVEDPDDEETQLTVPKPSLQRARSPTPETDDDVVFEGSKPVPDLSQAPSPVKRKRVSSSRPESPTKRPVVIGSDTFRFDAALVDAHLADIARFWRSEREPRGPEIEEVGRCMSCEYHDGCQWRSMKAAQHASRAPPLKA